jgi:hypothetical protein
MLPFSLTMKSFSNLLDNKISTEVIGRFTFDTDLTIFEALCFPKNAQLLSALIVLENNVKTNYSPFF